MMVLQMSASFVGHEDKVRGLEGEADGYLISPFEPEEFLETVRSLLASDKRKTTCFGQPPSGERPSMPSTMASY